MKPYEYQMYIQASKSLHDAWLFLTDVDGNISQDEEGRIVTANDPFIMDVCNALRGIIQELECKVYITPVIFREGSIPTID